MDNITATDVLNKYLQEANKTLEGLLLSEIVLIKSPIVAGLDDQVRSIIENLCDHYATRRFEKTGMRRLTVLLETEGGSIEVVERIYNVLRFHYDEVNFIVPNYAYSAGTVLALSGDNIYMDYYSVLGPIDPQIQNENGQFVPGMSYLAEYEYLMDKINKSPDIFKAEMTYLLRKFDPGTLFLIRQAIAYSNHLLIEWLIRHKFKNWLTTETTQTPVTDTMRKERAKVIASILGDTTVFQTHGRGISLEMLSGEQIKLQIRNYSEELDLSKAIRDYYAVFKDTCAIKSVSNAIHSRHGLVGMV